ncbi:GDP-mannose 4,6-dehydratase [Nocardioides caeni]|uniref:GDP-mannose 4,6-dehydratase n=1 Tax=Nocardioides caeni TaxID=574700 RepID=A0A4V6T5T3_9ACTN|nr:GDP-mannose 4,6-dehydratase [Nocardioides caeni]THV09206.1 GDP-mannose 4,6-dehydratase [Nocardioides caeni]
MTRRVLVTGVTGQDGVLLARRLQAAGDTVIGTVRPATTSPMQTYLDGVELVDLDLRDPAGPEKVVEAVAPDEIFHLAGFTSVRDSWDAPEEVTEVNVAAVERLLGAVERHAPDSRVFLASSSEVYGPDATNPQTEETPLAPVSPYGQAKARLHGLAADHRAAGRHVSVGVLYNHESPIRGTGFVTRRISRRVAQIAAGRADRLTLGNLDVSRDWGAATDVVDAMVRMVRADTPGEYVVATGVLHTLRELVEAAFAVADLPEPWTYVEQDPDLVRPVDAPGACGDPSRARTALGWEPTTTFAEVVGAMVRADQERLRRGIDEHPDYLSVR